MINISKLDLNYVLEITKYLTNNWYVVLPLAVFFYFLSDLVEAMTVFGIGALLSAGYIYPWMSNVLKSFYPDIYTFLQNREILFLIVFTVFFGVIFYGLYKLTIFLGSMVLSFVGILFLFNTFFGPHVEWYIPVTAGLVGGIIAGSYASRNSWKFVGFIAASLSSFVISTVGFALFKEYLFNFSEFVYLWLVFVFTLILLFVRVKYAWRKE
ncbi:MAG: hypothetical protein ACPL3B_00845 [Fervidobacterium sp.]